MNPEDRKWLANVSALWPRGDVGEMLDKTGDTRISTRARLSPQAAALSREIVGRLPASTRWCHGGHKRRVVGEALVSGRGSRWIPADAVDGPGEAYVWFTSSRSAAVE